MEYMQRHRNGVQVLTLSKRQGSGQPLKRIVTLTSGFFLGTMKERGPGALKDVLVLDESSSLTKQQIAQAEVFDIVDVSPGTGAYRYSIENRTPPRASLKRHVLTVVAAFNDVTAVDL
jgi:hypothetical protein